MTAEPSKWKPETMILWSVICLGIVFVLSIEVPLLLLGLVLGFVVGVIVVWRNPWGVFRFMEPEIEKAGEPLMQDPPGTGNGQHLTINVGQTNSTPEVRMPCKHCGSMVDIIKNPTCPKCGAAMK